MRKYEDIIARLEKAEGANFQLERDIDAFCHFGRPGALDRTPPPYTASIDAAIALVERMLKTYFMEMTVDPLGRGAKILYWPGGFGEEFVEIGPISAVSTDMPRAILLALFRALDAQEDRT